MVQKKKLTKRLDNWGGKKRCSVSLPRARPCFCFSLSLSQQTNLSKLMAFSAVSRATIPSSSLRLPAALPCPSAHPPSVCPPLAPLHFLHGVWSTSSTPTPKPHSHVLVGSLVKHFIVACMDEQSLKALIAWAVIILWPLPTIHTQIKDNKKDKGCYSSWCGHICLLACQRLCALRRLSKRRYVSKWLPTSPPPCEPVFSDKSKILLSLTVRPSLVPPMAHLPNQPKIVDLRHRHQRQQQTAHSASLAPHLSLMYRASKLWTLGIISSSTVKTDPLNFLRPPSLVD